MSIIAISGKKQSGKDTIGRIIEKLTKDTWENKKFADKVKDITCMLIGCKKEYLESEEFKNTILGTQWRYMEDGMEYEMTVRKMLQKVGTDAMRDGLHPDVWVNALMSEYKSYPVIVREGSFQRALSEKFPKWIITDCRFPNEAEAIKKKEGIIIRVNSKRCNNEDTHPSETSLDDYNEFDYVIDNDSSIEELIEKVKTILIKEKLV